MVLYIFVDSNLFNRAICRSYETQQPAINWRLCQLSINSMSPDLQKSYAFTIPSALKLFFQLTLAQLDIKKAGY